MSLIDKIFPLYLVSGRFGRDDEKFFECVRNCISSGAKLIQLREKKASARTFFDLSKSILKLKREFDFTLIINDRVDIAVLSGADGVHLGQDDIPYEYVKGRFPDLTVGLSTHSRVQFDRALETTLDYIAVGPMFKTKTKPEYEPIGLDFLRSIKKETDKPVIAIGGINFDNFLDVLNSGADSVAICSDIFSREKPEKMVEKYILKLKSEGFI